MALDYLDFDYSDDDHGTGCWDAMASVLPERLPALLHEAALVLRWAHQHFGAPQGDEGAWDYDLQAEAGGTPLALRYDAAQGRVLLNATPAQRATLTLTLRGEAHFGEALRDAFSLAT